MENQDLLRQIEGLITNQNTIMSIQFGHVKEKLDHLTSISSAQDGAIQKQDRRLIKVEQKAALFTKLGYAALVSMVVSAVSLIFGKHS